MTLTDASYQSQGAEAPDPVTDDDLGQWPVQSHAMLRDERPGRYGERPEPAEVTITCTCGADLWEWQEGYGSTSGTPLDAWEQHLREEAES